MISSWFVAGIAGEWVLSCGARGIRPLWGRMPRGTYGSSRPEVVVRAFSKRAWTSAQFAMFQNALT